MSALRWLTLLAVTVALVACATAPVRPTTAWPQRLAALRELSHYQFEGRMAVNAASDGFSAGVRWNQHDGDASVDFSAPLGFGAAHVERNDGVLSVTTSRGEHLEADAASAELAMQLGFDPPLESLRYWLVGASDPATPSIETLDAQQQLIHLEQGGWSVDCADYAPVAEYSLPRRLTVQRGTLRLRLVINAWQL
jgi:outer membrane lipoprotein LolB